jgi:ABC-type transport system involved in multi-copper enzyme maturation permease subunit
MIAVLSLGNEFQHRTLPLLLSQPVSRKTIWREKWLVLIAAIASSSFVYWQAWRSLPNSDVTFGLAAVIALISLCSAMFWTLNGKSTIGGLTLNTLQAVIIFCLVQAALWLLSLRSVPITTGMTFGAGVAGCLYALLMLWLGCRTLERFQTAGGIGGDDILMANPKVMSGAVARLLECRSTGPVLNLVRKEVRLLWPVWLLTAVVCLFLIGLAPFRPETPDLTNSVWAVASAAFVLAPLLIVVLAGTLSMGEERNLGTHAWHLTMPVSAPKQWWIKIVVAELAGVLSTAAVVVVGRFVFGRWLVMGPPMAGILLAAAVATLGTFWCACMVKGTVPAALFALPAMALVLTASAWGGALVGRLSESGVLDLFLARMHPFPIGDKTARWLFAITDGYAGAAWIAVPLIAFTLIQSRRLFRGELTPGWQPIGRRFVPLLVLALVFGALQRTPRAVAYRLSGQTWKVLAQVSQTLNTMSVDANQPVTLTFEELSKRSPLSELARVWLKDSTITFAPAEFTRHRVKDGKWSLVTFSHYATVKFPHGWTCKIADAQYAFGLVSCTSPDGSWGSPQFP